jgi:hypothetical protein
VVARVEDPPLPQRDPQRAEVVVRNVGVEHERLRVALGRGAPSMVKPIRLPTAVGGMLTLATEVTPGSGASRSSA